MTIFGLTSRSATLAVVAAATTFGVYISSSDVAEAAPRCSGASCEGLSPVTMGCDEDAYTVDWTIQTVRAELRYSPGCNAMWAKAIGTDAAYRAHIWGWDLPEAERTGMGSPAAYGESTEPAPEGSYSSMVPGDLWVRVCVFDGASDGLCTGEFRGTDNPPPNPYEDPQPEPVPEPDPDPEPLSDPDPEPEPVSDADPVSEDVATTASATSEIESPDAEVAVAPSVAATDVDSGQLPITGSESMLLALAGVGLTAAGAVLVRFRRSGTL